MDDSKSEPLKDQPIVDKGNAILWYHFMMDGVGVLLSWNAICTAFDWMNTKFPGEDASFIFTIINFAPNLIFQPLTVRFGYLISFNLRIIVPFLAMGILLAITPIVVQFSSEGVGFGLMCVVCFVLGGFNAIAQTSVFGLAGTMPPAYTGAVMIGNGVAGVMINVVRIICLAAFWYVNGNGLLLSTIVYFVISGAVLLLCLASQWLISRNLFVRERVSLTSAKIVDSAVVENSTEKELKGSNEEIESSGEPRVPPPTFRQVWGEVWYFAVLVSSCYIITFGMYPTVCISTNGGNMHYAWFSVLMLFIFNFCDFLGRYLPMLFLAGPKLLGVLVYGRFIFWVTFLLCATDQPPSWLFGGDSTWFKFLNMAAFGLSNGFSSTCCMIRGPMSVRPAWKDKAGSIMSTALVWGIFAGSVLALSFSKTVHPPSD